MNDRIVGFDTAWIPQDLIEVLPAAVYICDMEGCIVAFNRQAASIWGREPRLGQTDEKFCGAHRLFLSNGDLLPHAQTPMAGVLRSGEAARDMEVVIEQPKGDRVTVLVNIVPLRDAVGQQVGAVNCFQDLSSIKQAEHEREALRSALHQAQKMEAIGQLAGGMAHDFGNLLMGISNSLELIDQKLRANSLVDLDLYLKTAQEASRRASDLTHRLLAFARRQPQVQNKVNVTLVLANTQALIKSTLGPQIQLELALDNEELYAQLNANELENAIINLCINARDAMPEGGDLKLRCKRVRAHHGERDWLSEGSQDCIAVEVEDSGCGIAPELMARVCEPFFSTKPPGRGTGLGLAMVYGFAKSAGGRVELSSRLGVGTLVRILLPCSDALAPMPGPSAAWVAAPPPVQTVVLLVDDEDAVRQPLAQGLRAEGYLVYEACNAAEAVAVLSSKRALDIMVSDVGLPSKTNGWALALEAKQLRKHLPVLMMSGYFELAAAPKSELLAQLPMLNKPFGLRELIERLRALLKGPVLESSPTA